MRRKTDIRSSFRAVRFDMLAFTLATQPNNFFIGIFIMLRGIRLALQVTIAAFALGTAYGAPTLPAVVLPPLDSGSSRIFFSGGSAHGLVKIGDQEIGDVQWDQYLVVDALPGTYTVSCPRTNLLPETLELVVTPGQTRAFACETAPMGAGWALLLPGGAIGGAVAGAAAGSSQTKYSFKTHVAARPTIMARWKVIAYTKLSGPPSGP
jgi:hypothetical protein